MSLWAFIQAEVEVLVRLLGREEEVLRHLHRGGAAADLAILDALRRGGPGTFKELAERSGLERHAVARRLPELQDAGKVKPVYAHIEDMGASAAYWVASQAHKVYADAPTTQVGSIGTYLTLYDYSAVAEREGVKVHHFATGPLKGLGAEGTPITEEQANYLQTQVEKMQTEFDTAVRMARNLSRDQLAAVRTGGTFLAAEAKAKGLIDDVKTLDQVVKALAAAKIQ